MSIPLPTADSPRLLYCHCAFANVVPQAVKTDVLRRLTESGRPFDAVPDLCELSARKDPTLKELTTGACTIAACYPRAVRWLFQGAGSPLPETGVTILNMRTETAETVTAAMLARRTPETTP